MPRVAAVELPVTPLDPLEDEVLGRREAQAREAVAVAAAAGAGLVAFPEAFLPGYAHRAAPPEVARRGRALAVELATAHGVVVTLGVVDGDVCACLLATPAGEVHVLPKRYPTPGESRVWRPGGVTPPVRTSVGRVGVLVCADVLHAAAWRPLRGEVDLVVVAAAWPDYRGREEALPPWQRRLLGRVLQDSNAWRDEVLARGARYVGAPVVLANAVGPNAAGAAEEGFSGGSGGWSASGERLESARHALTDGAVVLVEVGPAQGPASSRLGRSPGWALFAAGYRIAAQLRRAGRGA